MHIPGSVIDVKTKFIMAGTVVFFILLVLSIFVNIAYPLLWNDEAETAMFAKRVVQYGYPKVHDSKNTLFLMELPDQSVGIDKRSDAYIGTCWGHYYYAALAQMLAETTENLYLKTAILRIPFALAGLLGLIIIAISASSLFNDKKHLLLFFLMCFTLLELLSISLALHMREVRYYSLLILFSGCIFYLYTQFVLFSTLKWKVYIPSMTLALLAVLNTFTPAYVAVIITIALMEYNRLRKFGLRKDSVYTIMPVLISIAVAIPLLGLFYKTMTVSNAFMEWSNITWLQRVASAFRILAFLKDYEFLYIIICARVAMITSWFYLKDRQVPPAVARRFYVSNMLSVFALIYLLLILSSPLRFIFERYYIFLQPFLALIILLDLFNLYILLGELTAGNNLRRARIGFVSAVVILFAINGQGKLGLIKGHIYELFHQYNGPLDFAIPYIQSRYKETKDLVIATNYEECAFMYYLGSKVIIGAIGNNLEEDLKLIPDIIIFRDTWTYTNSFFPSLFQKAKYERISFPISDPGFNNIPQISGGIYQHFFKTKTPDKEDNKFAIYTKQ